jgi:hypothetical protein
MIKPGSGDKKVIVLISGQELIELKRFTWMMSEAFGLDRRIENYQGTRPIGLYNWDLDCLLAALQCAVERKQEYPNENAPGLKEITNLFNRLSDVYRATFGEISH